MDELNSKRELLLRESMQKLFIGYYFDHKQEELESQLLADKTTCKSTINQRSLLTGNHHNSQSNNQFMSIAEVKNRQSKSRNFQSAIIKKLVTTEKSVISALTS